MMIEIILIVLCLALLVLSFYFSGSEAGFLSLNHERLLVDSKTNKRAKKLEKFSNNLPIVLMVTLLGNNLVNISFVATSERLWKLLVGERLIGLYLLSSTLLFLFLGEIFPKIIFRKFANIILYKTVGLLTFFNYLFSPITNILLKITSPFIDKLFRGFSEPISRKDFKAIVNDIHLQGELSEQERFFMENFSSFSKTRISEIMTPLVDLFIVNKKQTIKNLLDDIDGSLDMVPVYDKRIDNIIGFVEILEIFYSNNKKKMVSHYLKTPIYIPESITLDRIFSNLLDFKNKFIVALDEYGGCSGVFTWQDILDKIFGFKYGLEQMGEKRDIKEISKNHYQIDSSIDIDSFNNIFHQEILKDGFETLGGFINHYYGRIPEKGEFINYNNLNFKVLKSSKTSVDLLELKVGVKDKNNA